MSKYRYEMGGIIRDTEIDFPYYTDDIVELLEEKDQRIAELEEQLKNAIVPKFKPYDNFYTINDLNHIVCRGCIHIIIYNDRIAYVDTYGAEYECDFGKEMQQGLYTKEEAEAKLRELQGE